MTPFTLVVWIVTCLIWSTVWLFIKIGVRDIPPVTFAAYRLAIALIVLVPITVAQRVGLPRARRDYVLIASTGVVLLGINYALLNWGIQFVSSGLTAVLQAMTPAFGMVFAHFMLRDERMTGVKAAALLLGVAGVAIIFSDQSRLRGAPSAPGQRRRGRRRHLRCGRLRRDAAIRIGFAPKHHHVRPDALGIRAAARLRRVAGKGIRSRSAGRRARSHPWCTSRCWDR